MSVKRILATMQGIDVDSAVASLAKAKGDLLLARNAEGVDVRTAMLESMYENMIVACYHARDLADLTALTMHLRYTRAYASEERLFDDVCMDADHDIRLIAKKCGFDL